MGTELAADAPTEEGKNVRYLTFYVLCRSVTAAGDAWGDQQVLVGFATVHIFLEAPQTFTELYVLEG